MVYHFPLSDVESAITVLIFAGGKVYCSSTYKWKSSVTVYRLFLTAGVGYYHVYPKGARPLIMYNKNVQITPWYIHEYK